MSVFHIYGSHKNGCFGLALRASLVGSQPGSAPQWVGAWLPSRRPPHPDPTWNSSWYSPLSLLLLLIHRFNLEILLPLHQARLQRVLLACHHHHQHLRMEMVSTLGSLAFSSQSRNRSQCGDQSLNSKAIGQQTPVAEEGDKHWRRRKRPIQTQGRHCFNLCMIRCRHMGELSSGFSSSRSRSQSRCGWAAHAARGSGKQMRRKNHHQATPGRCQNIQKTLWKNLFQVLWPFQAKAKASTCEPSPLWQLLLRKQQQQQLFSPSPKQQTSPKQQQPPKQQWRRVQVHCHWKVQIGIVFSGVSCLCHSHQKLKKSLWNESSLRKPSEQSCW